MAGLYSSFADALHQITIPWPLMGGFFLMLYFLISCSSYLAAKYLGRYCDYLEDRNKKKLSKVLSSLCFPLFIIGIGGMFTLGVLDEYESKRYFRIHQEQAREVRALAAADASHDRLLQYRAASKYNAPGAFAAYKKLEAEIQDAEENNEKWYVNHLRANGLDPDDPDFFDFDIWLQKEYYKLGL